MKNAKATRLLETLLGENLAIHAVVDFHGKRVSPAKKVSVTIAEHGSTEIPVRNTGTERTVVGSAVKRGRKPLNNILHAEDERVVNLLSEKYEDIHWLTGPIDEETESFINGTGYYLTGEYIGDDFKNYKSFVIPHRLSFKEKMEWGEVIGNTLYDSLEWKHE